ncbi:YgaP family membrane protein [Planococcus lenghuensis]|uniref:Inner membrane protein YgaP-like transmembrane domain-containing protein n=1 Tax=Planococcus lenghuensis TaxID=2213202 RepID=A0A1Q2L0V5_9BACL|nr:DUF2892 domain-containing protein [Planococcus lenghuensis]AQQ54090.1 hypothetical protein B0X71_13910 [Planococcus lenghuensis]
MKQNIGTIDSMIRIAGGLSLLSYCTAKMAREKPSGTDIFMTVMGAQKVAEGITHYCPITDAMGLQEPGAKQAKQ